MKRYIPLILVLCLLLSGCAGVQIPDNTTTLPDETTQAPEGTTRPEETTVPNEALFPPISEPAIIDSGDYFIYTTDPDNYDYYEYYLGLDASRCKEDHLYRYYRDTKELILVVDKPVVCVQACGYGYLYVAEADKQTLMWTDAFGEEHIPVYTAQYGDISIVHYYNDYKTTEDKDIYTLEGNTHVVRIHNPEWTSEVLYEGEGITGFTYRWETGNYLAIFKGEEEWHYHPETQLFDQVPCKSCDGL